MRDDFSLIKFFKDPLFTLIPLFLLLTIPMIISGSSPHDQDGDPDEKMEEIRELRAAISALEAKIQDIKSQIAQLIDEIDILVKQLEKAERSRHDYDEVEELINRIMTLKENIENKMEELERLDKELEAMRASNKRSKETMEKIAGKAESIRKELEVKKTLLKEISVKIDRLMDRMPEDVDKEEEIRRQIDAAKAKNRELEQQVEEAKNLGEAGGFVEYKVVDKSPVFFEATDNTIVPVDPDHYEGTRTPEGAIFIWKKESVSGEMAAELDSPRSKFMSRLSESDPSQEYIVFFVHNDSFKVFRKAREIAFNAGFMVGWNPLASEYIGFSDTGRQTLGR